MVAGAALHVILNALKEKLCLDEARLRRTALAIPEDIIRKAVQQIKSRAQSVPGLALLTEHQCKSGRFSSAMHCDYHEVFYDGS